MIVIRPKSTLKYLKPFSEDKNVFWANNSTKGFDFESIDKAIEFIKEKQKETRWLVEHIYKDKYGFLTWNYHYAK